MTRRISVSKLICIKKWAERDRFHGREKGEGEGRERGRMGEWLWEKSMVVSDGGVAAVLVSGDGNHGNVDLDCGIHHIYVYTLVSLIYSMFTVYSY